MELKTYEDTLECIIADNEIELAKKDAEIIQQYEITVAQYDRILELESELDIEKQRTQDALNQVADTEMKNRLRRLEEYEKCNQKEAKTVFNKVFPGGIEMLKDLLRKEKKLTPADVCSLLLMTDCIEKDTNYLIDKGGRYLNKEQIAKKIGEDKSNFNSKMKKLIENRIIFEDDLGGKKKAYRVSDMIFYNGKNRTNQH